MTGSIDPTASTTVTGVETLFLTELVVGDRITVSGLTRTVTAIASNTSLTVDTAFTDVANDASPGKLHAIQVWRSSDGVEKAVMDDIGNVGFGTPAPKAPTHINRTASNYLGPCFLLTGKSKLGAVDEANGFGFYLVYNATGNRQFSFANTESGLGIRIINNTIDGYNSLTDARMDLSLGSDTNGTTSVGKFTTMRGRKITATSVTGATYNVLATDELILVNYAGDCVITFTTAMLTANVGQVVTIKDVSGAISGASKSITIATESTQTIDGLTTDLIFKENHGTLKLYIKSATEIVDLNKVLGTSYVKRYKPAEYIPGAVPPALSMRGTFPILAFDNTVDETCYFTDELRGHRGGDTTVVVEVASTATSGNFIVKGAFERNLLGTDDMDADSFGTEITSSATAVSGTSGVSVFITLTFTNAQIDSMANGESYRLRLTRFATDAGDTVAADMQVRSVKVTG